MCKVCGYFKCHPQCPNAPEPKIMGVCEECGEELREDYEYYTDNSEVKYCSLECAIKYNGIKSKDWSDDDNNDY